MTKAASPFHHVLGQASLLTLLAWTAPAGAQAAPPKPESPAASPDAAAPTAPAPLAPANPEGPATSPGTPEAPTPVVIEAPPAPPVTTERSSDALATPEDLATGAPALAPTSVVVRVAPERPALPIRAERRLALLGELGWNGLAGFGPNLTFHAHPHVSFDLGAGLSLLGWKVGLRGRYNLFQTPVTPFLGAGIIASSGFGSSTVDSSDPEDPAMNEQLNVKVLPGAFMQAVVGVDWTNKRGFTMVGALGYAWLLSKDNVEIVTGTPTDEERQAFDVIFGSSGVVSLAIGYSFK